MLTSSIASTVVRGASALAESGIGDCGAEARTILAGLMGLRVTDLWLVRESMLPAGLLRRYSDALERRANGEPLAYVLGSVGFRHLDLRIDQRVLIPRPETEGLVDHVLAWGERSDTEQKGHWGVAADIGTGSGCIALSLATEGRFERIIATDSSTDAIAVAELNRAAVQPKTPVHYCLGSMLQPVSGVSLRAIVANPPYIAETEYVQLDASVRDYEPKDALVSAEDGMLHTRVLLEGARELLSTGGLLAIEVDSSRAPHALLLAKQLDWVDARIADDLFGRPRYLLTTKES